MIQLPADKAVILFDGYCHLCSGLVILILKRDQRAYFAFAPLNGELGTSLKQQFNIPESTDSIVLIENGRAFLYAEAALRIAARLGGIYKLLLIGRVLPANWRDRIYRWVAKNRFQWFGKRNTCYLPDDQFRDRFL